jgi:hypothetical protein
MAGQINLKGTEIKQGRGKIFFHPVIRTAFIFYRGDERTAVSRRYLESFHFDAKIII